jgi:hypothetical protein
MNAEIRQAAIKVQQSLERDLFLGNASTCTSNDKSGLTIEDLKATLKFLQSASRIVWYISNEWIPVEIKGKPGHYLLWPFGDDDVLLIHPDKLEGLKAQFPYVGFQEYPEERHKEQARREIEKIMERYRGS